MEKVPQIVSERLKTASVTVNHPDADLLTAFSERTLPPSERAVVLTHLANCMECREVVALALPPTDSVQEVARPSETAWFTWPVLRWGAIAAGIIVVGSFGFVAYQHRHETAENVASRSAPASEKEAKEAKNILPAAPTQELTQDKQKSTPAQSPQVAKSETAAAPGPSAAPEPSNMLLRRQLPTAGAQRGPHVQFQQSTTFQNQAPGTLAVPAAPSRIVGGESAGNQPVPAQSEAVEVASAAPSANNETASLDAGLAQIGSQSGSKQLDARVERSKPATPTVQMTAPAPAKAIGGPVAGNLARMVAASPAMVTWNINSSGDLQRSFDQGSTWQNVDVNRRADNAPQAYHGAAKEMPTDALKDALKKDASSPTFRAVASNGPDVWAGASGGLLYHSTDAGGHWTRVVPSALGTSLSGDIVSLEFADPKHGRIVSSAPEIWTTSDGGQTWLKQ